MLRFQHYYYKDTGEEAERQPKLLLSLDWFTYEDSWSQRYMFDRPMWNDEMMAVMKKSNEERCKWFTVRLNLFYYRISVDFKLKHIGNVYYGRVMKDIPEVPDFVRRNREKKKEK